MSARVVCLFACVLASCSFMGLDDYDLKPCVPREPCRGLNAQLGAGQCEEYVCDESGFGCVLKPRDRDHDGHLDPIACKDREDLGPLDCDDDNTGRNAALGETCDGVDNDCDEWIDEGTRPELDDPSPIRFDDDLEHLSVSVAGDTLYAALTFDREPPDRNELWTLAGEERTAEPIGDAACPIANDKGGRCNFRRIAISAAPHASFAAGINYFGCGSGQLRVAAGGDPSLGDLAEGSGRSFGVDIASDSCTESTPCKGVSEPSIAALPELGNEPAQALVLWNAPHEASACPRWCAEACQNDGAVTIAGLGVQLDDRGTAMDDRSSEPLGDGMAGGGPAVIAWPGAGAEGGYFVAFAGSEQLELRFVPRLSGSAASVREGLLEGALAAPGATHPVLTLDASTGDAPRGLALAYRTAAGSAVAFAPLEFDRAAEPALSARTPPIEFETTEPIASGPVLAFARDGFFESEDARKTGGWLLMWIEGAKDGAKRLMAARIALTGPHRLGRPLEVARGDLAWPFAYVNQVIDGRDGLAYGFVQDRALHLRGFTCNPMQSDGQR